MQGSIIIICIIPFTDNNEIFLLFRISSCFVILNVAKRSEESLIVKVKKRDSSLPLVAQNDIKY